MAHRFSDHVVGGVECPRYLMVGAELSPNVSFEESTIGVGSTYGANAREFDATTPFGDYVLTVEDDSAVGSEYAYLTIDTGAAIAGKRFIVLFHARDDDDDDGGQPLWCEFYGLSETKEMQWTLDSKWRQYVHEVSIPADASGNSLVYRIYPYGKSQGDAGTGKVRIDNFRCRQVMAYFEFPLPSRGNEHGYFQKELQAQNRLVNGTRKRYLAGYRFFYDATYERLTAAQEILRTRLINTAYDILLFPHKDSAFCAFMDWAEGEDYERIWAFGVAPLGHDARIILDGVELLTLVPEEIIDALTEYAYDDDGMIYEGDEYIL